MTKEKKILKNYLLYFLLMILVCMVGISGVFADTLENIGYLDENSEVLVEVSYTGNPLPLQRLGEYQLGQVEAMNINVSNFTFNAGTTYSLEFFTSKTPLTYANAFTVVGNGSNNQPVTCSTVGITYDDIKYLNFRFNCPNTVNAISLRIFNSSNNYIMDTGLFTWGYVYLRKVTSSTDTSILESQNAQIIQGQQDIINNQNANTDKTIESQKVCKYIDKNNIEIDKKYITINNVLENDNAFGVTNYINIINSTIKVISVNNNTLYASSYCFYNTNKTKINCQKLDTLQQGQFINIPDKAVYFRTSIFKNNNQPQYEICTNGNQALNDSIIGLDDTLNNSDIDDNNIGSAFDEFNDYLDENSTITQLITLPITLYTAILNNVNGSCSPFNLGQLYGEDLILPCINISQYLGSSLWSMIDIIISGFAIFSISKKMIKVFNNFSSLREGDVIDD